MMSYISPLNLINYLKKGFVCSLLMISQAAFAQQSLGIVPQPNHIEARKGSFLINAHTPILCMDGAGRSQALYFQGELLKTTGVALGMQQQSGPPAITLKKTDKPGKNPEAYTLDISSGSIVISSSGNEGLFYGVISLLQLIRDNQITGGTFSISCLHIEDQPRYSWRGFMQDESRHFFGKEKVKSILDWMAFYKLNHFHWHLTDEPAWRLEIKKYPELTLRGSITADGKTDGSPAYYSQADIREIVAYAADRFITVVPEIDMPGHATAANKAYPEYSGGGSAEHPEFTFDPGKEATYQYLTNILREVNVLFPAQMIHIGGDEVSFGNKQWQTNTGIQKLMSDHHLSDLKMVENYFIKRMADSVLQLDNKVLAWDETVGAGFPVDKSIIFWWRQDKPEQLQQALDRHYRVVLCPRLPFYFDFVQDSLHKVGRKWNGSYNDLQKVYSFSHELIPAAGARADLILGIQANLWTETVRTERRLDYMLFPRIAALAEAAWTDGTKKNFGQFMIRLQKQLPLYKQAGIYYYDPFSNAHVEPQF